MIMPMKMISSHNFKDIVQTNCIANQSSYSYSSTGVNIKAIAAVIDPENFSCLVPALGAG